MTDSGRLIDGVVDTEADTSGSKVREFRFGYRRHVAGFPLMDSFLEISVDTGGVVRRVVLADVTSTSGTQTPATRSEATAQSLFLQAANVRADSWSVDIVATVKRFRVAYVLPYDVETASGYPVLRGEIVYKHGPVTAPIEDATLSLTGANPQLVPLAPWSGLAPEPKVANGRWCGRDQDCTSGKCFFVSNYYGVCGACSSGSNCSSSSCNPPNPGRLPATPSVCGTGAAGSGCETTSDCTGGRTCQPVLTTNLGYTVRTCSTCATDSNCPGDAKCSAVLDWTGNRAYRGCVVNGSLSLAALCSSDASCASGKCANYLFPDGTSVGVCSTCKTGSQCASGICAPPRFVLDSGFAAGACQ
jgi:hypothetical protein